jgi:hypothetical protein
MLESSQGDMQGISVDWGAGRIGAGSLFKATTSLHKGIIRRL